MRLGETEPANWAAQTVNEVLRSAVQRFGERPALLLKRPVGVCVCVCVCVCLGVCGCV